MTIIDLENRTTYRSIAEAARARGITTDEVESLMSIGCLLPVALPMLETIRVKTSTAPGLTPALHRQRSAA